MPVRATHQQILSATVPVKLWNYSESRIGGAVVPTTAVNVWVGSHENVSKTTGYLVNQTIPFIASKYWLDPTQELWCISDSATPTVAVYEDLEQ